MNQGIQNICWSFTGTDTIATSSLSQLGTTPSLSPVYYDYLSADAFTDTINPLAIMLNNGLRQLSTDGNTLDYVPMMSVQGYDPVTAASLPQPQPVATAKDQKMSQIAFNQLTKANVHVSDSYKLNGFAPNQLPASSSAIMNRVNQIKQLVYQYGAVQFGLEAEISLDSPYYDSQNNASYVPYSAATAGSELVTTYDNQEYLNQDHELQIVGYDDNYSANNFTQSPGMNGAFVVKNTWGTSFGIGGYFYLSYADIYVAGSEIYADEVATTQSGEKTYSATNISPEASGYYYQLSESSKIVNTIFANTYTSQTVGTNQVEQLNSISAYMDQAGVSVELLYKTGAANSGTYTQLGTYTFTDAGYQTIPLSNAISLPNNTTYTVAIQILSLPSSCTTLNVPVQCKSDGSTGLYPVMTTGNSWSKYSGSWTNLSSTERANLYLGANTDVEPLQSPSVSYETQVQTYGWVSPTYNGQTNGTTGLALRAEALKASLLNLPSNLSGNIQYQAYVQGMGWQSTTATNGAIAGTVGQAKRMEAFRMQLTGSIASQYDVYYRAYVQNIGWLGWAKNWQTAGTSGMSYRIEAVQIQLVAKGSAAPSNDSVAFSYLTTPTVNYSAHVQNIGWQAPVVNGALSGTTGKSLRMEALKVELQNIASGVTGGITYRSQSQKIGWQAWVSDNSISGTTGQGLRDEAIELKLTGGLSNYFNVYYRAHVQSIGWQAWVSNGATAGTVGKGLRMEALEIKIVPKANPAP
ncbi:lectin like domain-containing protein [Lactococcus protaetiae]|uniref:Peptidase C1A papain C-terminal domain-containing protein n=1 Tax=Lactococcus protaetiae TaxID=2592653 RepID=A0A514Z7D3_9LACT|nr:lectin like domain-containing protein [Lactococcus protaetiae]QDK70502.1 hypothetical protein FLP15_04070 [Lactococcus protaetiae]